MKRSISLFVFAVLFLPLLAGTAFSEPLPQMYQGTRPLGMGGAFTAVANDHNALIYNPAGLTQLQGGILKRLNLLNLEAEWSDDAQQLIDDLDAVPTGDALAATTLMQAYRGKHFRLRADTFPNIVTKRFGFGVLVQAAADGEFHGVVSPRLDLAAFVDATAMFSLAHATKGGGLAIGVTGKMVRRKGIVQSLTAIDIALDGFDPFENLDEEQSATAFDVGIMLKPDMPGSPTFAVAALNLTDLDFGPLGLVPYQVNVGAAFTPKLGPLAVTFAADLVDVTRNLTDDEDWEKRTNYGAEARLWKFLAVRAGMHQSYPTVGATIDLWIFRVDAAVYSEEIGAYGGQQEDKRYIVRLDLI